MKIAINHSITSAGAMRALYETACRLVGCHGLQVFSLAMATTALGIPRGLALGMSNHDFR